jgi:hypothetical protein
MKAYDTRRTGANMDSISYLMRAGHECTMPTRKANAIRREIMGLRYKAKKRPGGGRLTTFHRILGRGQASTTVVALKEQGLVQMFLSQTPRLFGENDRGNNFSLFSLGTPRTFLLKAVKAVPTFQDKRRLVHIAKEIQTSIVRYLVPVKVDDPESCSHISVISVLGLALGRSRQAASRKPYWQQSRFFCDRVNSLTQLGEFLGD